MRYAYGMSYPQLVGTLRHSVKFQDQLSLHFTPNLFLKDEFVGNVEGDNIWLQKIEPGFFNFPGRVFSGKISRCEGGVTIQGKFKFYSSSLILTIVAICFVTLFFSSGLWRYDTNGIVVNVIVIVCLDVLIIAHLFLNIPLRGKSEAFVTHYLENLEKLYPFVD